MSITSTNPGFSDTKQENVCSPKVFTTNYGIIYFNDLKSNLIPILNRT